MKKPSDELIKFIIFRLIDEDAHAMRHTPAQLEGDKFLEYSLICFEGGDAHFS